MAVFNGKRNDDSPGIGGAYANQVECGIVVARAQDEVAGVGALGANVVKLFLVHRLLSRLMLPPPFAMTADEIVLYKVDGFPIEIQIIFLPSRHLALFRQPGAIQTASYALWGRSCCGKGRNRG